jgi:hypothetical protein
MLASNLICIDIFFNIHYFKHELLENHRSGNDPRTSLRKATFSRSFIIIIKIWNLNCDIFYLICQH